MKGLVFAAAAALSVMAVTAQADHNAGHQCRDDIPGSAAGRFADNGDTVLDTRTNRVWAKCSIDYVYDPAADDCVSNSNVTYTWREALQAVADFNSDQAAAGNPSDWRLPNIKELGSLINAQCLPATFAGPLPVFRHKSQLWSSTPFMKTFVEPVDGQTGVYRHENQAWAVQFSTGKELIKLLSEKSSVLLVRDNGN